MKKKAKAKAKTESPYKAMAEEAVKRVFAASPPQEPRQLNEQELVIQAQEKVDGSILRVNSCELNLHLAKLDLTRRRNDLQEALRKLQFQVDALVTR